MNEKFSTRAKNALKEAQTIARDLSATHISTAHLLYGILNEISSFVSEVLLKNKLTAQNIKTELANGSAIPVLPNSMWEPKLSTNLQSALETAAAVAAKYQYQFVGTEHFLYGILDQTDNTAQKILIKNNIDVQQIKRNLQAIFDNVSKFPELSKFPDPPTIRDLDEGLFNAPALEYFASDLTKRAKEGQIDPLIGRQPELTRLISILGRRTKNNPVLIGDPGVGKTAIVEGLALQIYQKQVPETLIGKRILTLDMALLVAGTMFRGEFENRIKQVIEEVSESKDTILFIDELHTVVGAGASTGSLDAANIFKPALARGDLRVIGATTLHEYKKHIEPDSALERRFQPIMVMEPSIDHAIQIVRGLRANYEKHHGVEIPDESLKSAVFLSSRYISDRFLPDKAIDLIDETASYVKTRLAGKGNKTSPESLERELADLIDQKKQAVMEKNFTLAKTLKARESQLIKQIERLSKSTKSDNKKLPQITTLHITDTLSRITGIPVRKIAKKETDKLMKLEKILANRVVGQKEAVRQIAKNMRMSKAGLSSHGKPLGSFMFLGPSGVGKTLLARTLAKEMFGDEKSLIRLDMSELMERHNAARLIGAPAGYVGYEEGGRLTEQVRRRPYSVVLFDEIEKAHPEVLNILLQIMDEGVLTDAAGKTANFKNTVIIMTTNIGLSHLNQWAATLGFDSKDKISNTATQEHAELREKALSQLRSYFQPEFLGRVDKIIVFNPLARKDISKIVRQGLLKLNRNLGDQNIYLKYSPNVIRHLARLSYDPRFGARMVEKNLQELCEDRIAEAILTREIVPFGKYLLDLNSKDKTNKFVLKKVSA